MAWTPGSSACMLASHSPTLVEMTEAESSSMIRLNSSSDPAGVLGAS